MGYYTKFDIQVVPPHDFQDYGINFENYCKIDEKASKRLAAIDDTFSFYNDEEFLSFETLTKESHKWDDSQRVQSMIQLTKEFPDIGFLIYGDGKDPFDRWREFYLNGQYWHMEGHVIIEYDAFPYSIPRNYINSYQE